MPLASKAGMKNPAGFADRVSNDKRTGWILTGRRSGSRSGRLLGSFLVRGLVLGGVGGLRAGGGGWRRARGSLGEHRAGQSHASHEQGSDRKFTHHDVEPRKFKYREPGRNPASRVARRNDLNSSGGIPKLNKTRDIHAKGNVKP